MHVRAAVSLLAGLLVLPASCWAQGEPVEAVANHTADGGATVLITNHYQRPMTAFVLTTEYTTTSDAKVRGRGVEYFDSLLNPWHDKSFAPGETRVLRFGPSRGTAAVQVDRELKAALFDDGRTFGDADTVALILTARKAFFEELGKAISLLRSAQDTHMTREDLMSQAARQMITDLAAVQDPEEKRAVANPFATIQSNLRRSPSAPVENVVGAMLQMFLRLRQALLSAKPPVAAPGTTVNPGP